MKDVTEVIRIIYLSVLKLNSSRHPLPRTDLVQFFYSLVNSQSLNFNLIFPLSFSFFFSTPSMIEFAQFIDILVDFF